MGLYSQTLYEYMIDNELDPFNELDQIEAGRSLLSVEYDVPKEVMDTLLQRFVVRYINNEIGFTDITTFRMELMKYAIQRRPWYEKMYNMFEQTLPFDFTTRSVKREMSQEDFNDLVGEVKNEIESIFLGKDGLIGGKTYSRVMDDKGKTVSSSKGDRDEKYNIDTFTKGDSRRDGHNITRDTGKDKITKDSSGRSDVSEDERTTGRDTTITTKGGRDTKTHDNRNAHGFGSINQLAEPGIMVDNSDVKTGTDITDYDSTINETTNKNTRVETDTNETHSDKQNENRIKDTRKDEFTNERNKRDDVSSKRGSTEFGRKSKDESDRKNEVKESTKHANKSDRIKDEERLRGEKRDSFQSTEGKRELSETINVDGKVVWKPQLIKEFYELFIIIDEEWVRDVRDLFSYIY